MKNSPVKYFKKYVVNGNSGNDNNDGLSETNPMKTLTAAMAASHASIAVSAGYAARNVIYYMGDNAEVATETLTTLAQKTDIIGVGSYDANAFPYIIGNHDIVGSFVGCRFINMGFRTPAAGDIGFNVPSTVSGLAFLNCQIMGDSAVVGTKGIVATEVESLTIKGCTFKGLWSVDAIEIGAGASNGLIIEDNKIESGADGIVVNASFTTALRGSFIRNNEFKVVSLVVDDNSDLVVVGDNKGVTESDGTVALTFDYNAALSYNNIITCSASTTSIYPVQATIPT